MQHDCSSERMGLVDLYNHHCCIIKISFPLCLGLYPKFWMSLHTASTGAQCYRHPSSSGGSVAQSWTNSRRQVVAAPFWSFEKLVPDRKLFSGGSANLAPAPTADDFMGNLSFSQVVSGDVSTNSHPSTWHALKYAAL